MMEEGGKALAAYMKPREQGLAPADKTAEWTDLVKTFGRVFEYWLADPSRTAQLQSNLGKAYLDLWGTTARRMAGEQVKPAIEPSPRDGVGRAVLNQEAEGRTHRSNGFPLQQAAFPGRAAAQARRRADRPGRPSLYIVSWSICSIMVYI